MHNPSVRDRLFPHSDKLSSKKTEQNIGIEKHILGHFFPRHRKQLVFLQEISLKIVGVVVLMFFGKSFSS